LRTIYIRVKNNGIGLVLGPKIADGDNEIL